MRKTRNWLQKLSNRICHLCDKMKTVLNRTDKQIETLVGILQNNALVNDSKINTVQTTRQQKKL